MNDFLFADDSEDEVVEATESWKILIVDDEPEVHNITRLVLNDFTFDGAKLELISAYSGKEAENYSLLTMGTKSQWLSSTW